MLRKEEENGNFCILKPNNLPIRPKVLFFLNILINLNLYLNAYFVKKTFAMQTSVPRQNHAQNLLSLATFMLIICYYAFNGMPQDTFETKYFLKENSPEQNKTIEFEKSLSHLRAALLMDADDVQINGLLYEVENSLGNFISKKKAKSEVQRIYEEISLGNRTKAIRYINQLPTLLLLQ